MELPIALFGMHTAQHAKISILLVEDHPTTRVGLRKFLQQNDLTVVGEATNGVDAVRLARELNPDVILMDVGMPDMDGITASQIIRDGNPTAKIIMLTVHDRDEDIFAALAAGANGYCLKDIGDNRLVSAILSVHAGDFWLDKGIAGRVVDAAVGPGSEGSQHNRRMRKHDNDGTFETLSPREHEVLLLLIDGLSNQQMAEKLGVSPETIKTHMRHIMEKLAVTDRTQAAIKALRQGIV